MKKQDNEGRRQWSNKTMQEQDNEGNKTIKEQDNEVKR